MEKTIYHQLSSFLEESKLLHKYQFGFRNNMSTEQAAVMFLDDIRSKVDKGELVGAVFIDLSKAFDTVSHSQLISKLSSYGIHDKELDWFTDYLFNRQAVVKFGNNISSTATVYSGVPQGSILGPLLFLIIFNDLTDVVKHSRVIKYADDTVLYVSDKDVRVISRKLTNDLTKLSNWLTETELVINLKKGKTEALLFGTSQKVSKDHDNLIVHCNDLRIANTTSYKYLGVTIDSSLNLNSFFQQCYKKVSSRLRLLWKLRPYLDRESAHTIYRSMVLPNFTYCGLLLLHLNVSQQRNLTSIQNRAENIVNYGCSNKIAIQSIENANKKRACIFVRSCLANKLIDVFDNRFELMKHKYNT